ncbi:pseudouridine-5-phosphate glycosidase [Sporosarcina sp. P12(2017)]|uniref:pseudouridine-5'-phosphate glycosidase n=1 Tax=unclassified Sporosarcina TaxID=2647733 RepID=UPI000C1723FA|nr:MULTISPECIES: pseudouridine-5'-phosphate glycosidase [unclassified Sporosarcina]PIC58683.1 pseudouridine-5-phosphate glycosidase [Sporosarcina sp. P10]PIC62002.1 pseudouridine-5-phosphate glycosidase [Sporosarcina sp. P12(2017)]
MRRYVSYSEEVKEAMKYGKPLVALESTIITYGMPYPENVKAAREVQQIVRDHGAVPATIAIMDGKIKIGLTDEELERFGDSKGVIKASRRDISYLIATKKPGATTVAASMFFADLARIRVFTTGAIGGVHRGVEQTMDISADLEEFARTSVAVVCSGAKSILDLGKTLEYLETKGVPVIGYQTDICPAFYTRNSAHPVDYRVDEIDMMAEMLRVKWNLGLEGSAIIANPIPEEYAMDQEYMDGLVSDALKEAEEMGISGKNLTPHMLKRVQEMTGGKSLEANIALVKSNAELAAKLAVSFNGN